MQVIFFGASKFVIPIIEVLYKNFDLALVVTTERNVVDAVPRYCIENKIPYLSASSSSDLTTNTKLKTTNAQLGVLAYFGILLKQEVLDLFPKGILNIHPSLLPKYRGTTPGQTAILQGDTITGVSVIKLDEKMDHGPILDQVTEPILENDTSETLYDRLFTIGSEMLTKDIRSFLDQPLIPKAQDDSKATVTKMLSKESGYFDITNPPIPEKLNRMIRAYYPWPGVWSKLQIADGVWRMVKFLPEKKIQMEGKKPVSYKDFLNGYPTLREVIDKLT